MTINARVVVVGASDVGISFFENLCFCPHLRFNNLTLISKRGLPRSLQSTSCVYTAEEMALLSLLSWVNICEGIFLDKKMQVFKFWTDHHIKLLIVFSFFSFKVVFSISSKVKFSIIFPYQCYVRYHV